MNLKRAKKVMGTMTLVLSLAVIVIGTLSVTAADVVVTRDLPDEPVGPNEDIHVTVTQSGFYRDAGWVNETIPAGFEYMKGSVVDGYGYSVVIPQDSEESPRVITLEFGSSDNKTTISYVVTAKTEAAIEHAAFSGTWSTLRKIADPPEYETGDVTGDTTLTLAVPTPTPTQTSGGNGGGSSGGGGVTTSTPTGTVSPEPGETALPTGGATASPATTPAGSPGATPKPTGTPGPTKKPLIPGFEAAFAIAGLLAVSYLVARRTKA